MDLTNFGIEKKNNLPKAIDDNNLNFDYENFSKDYIDENTIQRYMPWFLKYKVEKFEDLIITKEIKQIIDYLENFKQGKSILLYSRPGSGKTTTITLIAEHYGYEIFELNASDSRNKKSINETIGNVIKQKSLFAKNKLILIDEVDGAAGNEDRGGIAEIAKIIKSSKYPIIFTANDEQNDKLKPIKKVAKFIDFENHSKKLLETISKKIFMKENIEYNEKELIEFIEKRNTADIRGFINDIQASVIKNKFEPNEDMEIRDYKKKIENLLEKIYYSYPEDSYKSSFNTDLNIDDMFLYVEENTPNAYAKTAIASAFNEISKADIFRGRIRKWQYWRFLVYINFYLTYGVSSVKSNPNKIIVKKNQRILKKWIYSNKVNSIRPRTRAEKNKDAEPKFIEKLAKTYHTSANSCRKSDIFYFAFQYKNDSTFREYADKKFEIDESIKKTLMEL